MHEGEDEMTRGVSPKKSEFSPTTTSHYFDPIRRIDEDRDTPFET